MCRECVHPLDQGLGFGVIVLPIIKEVSPVCLSFLSIMRLPPLSFLFYILLYSVLAGFKSSCTASYVK